MSLQRSHAAREVAAARPSAWSWAMTPREMLSSAWIEVIGTRWFACGW